MKELYRKYINNTLSSEDLKSLKNIPDSESDKDLLEVMCEEWTCGDEGQVNTLDSKMYRIKDELDRKLFINSHSKVNVYYKIVRWAAFFLLPLFIISTFYFYSESNKLESEKMIVSTGNNEKATITLPDGTLVTLNSNSELSYVPKLYNNELRQLSFSGEGYFIVSKDKNKPFQIDAEGLCVEVLGTTFNLSVKKQDPDAELFLESGSVKFTSLLKREAVVLHPNQKVIMNKQTGDITVRSAIENEEVAWKRNELIFHNVPLCKVISKIESTYNVKIEVHGDSVDAFTGTLVTNDLNGVLEVLGRTCKLKVSVTDGKVLMERLKD